MIEATICSLVSRLSGHSTDIRENPPATIDVAAPDQAATHSGNDFLHLFDADIDPGQRFHGVRRCRPGR